MNDPDDEKIKAEIDKIMSNINKIIKKIENLEPSNSDHPEQNKD